MSDWCAYDDVSRESFHDWADEREPRRSRPRHSAVRRPRNDAPTGFESPRSTSADTPATSTNDDTEDRS